MTADREALSGEIARVLPDALGRIGIWDVTDAERAEVADALADLLAARERGVRAEALREAARDVHDAGFGYAALRLHDRADRIEATR